MALEAARKRKAALPIGAESPTLRGMGSDRLS